MPEATSRIMSCLKLFDEAFLLALMKEFQWSMKGLLSDLCDDLEQQYPEAAARLRLPVELIRLVGDAVSLCRYSHWRIVGWIETLNDLVYVIDLHEQAKRHGRDIEFLEQLYAECRQSWYEHGYAEELFPGGAVADGRLAARIGHLCRRLAEDVTRQALLWDPALTCEWVRRRRRSWSAGCDLAADFEHPGGLDIAVVEGHDLGEMLFARGVVVGLDLVADLDLFDGLQTFGGRHQRARCEAGEADRARRLGRVVEPLRGQRR